MSLRNFLLAASALTAAGATAAVLHSGGLPLRSPDTSFAAMTSEGKDQPFAAATLAGEPREAFAVETLPPLLSATVGQSFVVRPRQVINGTPPFKRTLSGPGDASLGANGALTVTPARIGLTGPYTLTVTDARGRAVSTQMNLEVSSPLSLNGSVPGWATVDQPYRAQFKVAGGRPPYAWSFSGYIPPGLSFANGEVSGTPTQGGRFDGMVVTALDADNRQAFSGSMSIEVAGPMDIEPLPARLSAVVARTQVIPATAVRGGTPPFRRTLTGPEGVTMSPDGSLEINARRAGALGPFTLTVQDGRGQTSSSRMMVDAVHALSVSTRPAPILMEGVESSVEAPSVQGGISPFSYALRTTSTDEVPPGMVYLAASGVLAGTPTKAGTFGPYQVEVRDAMGAVHRSLPFNVSVSNSSETQPAPREVLVDGARCQGIKGWDCVSAGQIRVVEFRYQVPRKLSQANFGCDYVSQPTGAWDYWNGQEWMALDLIDERPCEVTFRPVGATAIRFVNTGAPLKRVWTPKGQGTP